MKPNKILAVAAFAVLPFLAVAQNPEPTITTVTNIVTITVTNIVTVTNVVTAPPAPAPVPAPTAVLPASDPKYPWESSLTAGLTLTRGNSHTLLYSGNFESAKKTPENEYNLGLSGAYGSQNSEESVNTYGGHAQWNHLFTERFYGYLRADALRDFVADVDYRITLGPGAGYYFIKNKTTFLSAEAGAGVEFQRIRSKTVIVGTNTVNKYQDESFATVRFAEKFEHKFENGARIWQNVEFLPQVDKFDNYIVNFQIGAEAALTKKFSLKTYLEDNYANRPANDRLKNDVKLVSGVSYKF